MIVSARLKALECSVNSGIFRGDLSIYFVEEKLKISEGDPWY